MNIMEQLKVKTGHLEEFGEIKITVDSYVCKEIFESVKEQKLGITFLIKKFKDIMLLDGNITGCLTMDCCRCLESFNYPLNLGFNKDYPATAEEVDVEDEVRQALILNVPDKPLCKNECSGLCAHCGKNLNLEKCSCKTQSVDPRWEKLKDRLKTD